MTSEGIEYSSAANSSSSNMLHCSSSLSLCSNRDCRLGAWGCARKPEPAASEKLESVGELALRWRVATFMSSSME